MQEATKCLAAAEAAAKAANVPATYFELVTMAALIGFRRAGCDVVVLECGLGGRLDATSVVRETAVASVVSVGLDHVAVLGPGLEDVAKEKAGIFRKTAVDDRHEILANVPGMGGKGDADRDGGGGGTAIEDVAIRELGDSESGGRTSTAKDSQVSQQDGVVHSAVIGPGPCAGLLAGLATEAGVGRVRIAGGGGAGDPLAPLALRASSSSPLQEFAPLDYDEVNSNVARAIVEELAAVRGHRVPVGPDLEAALAVRPPGRFEVLRLTVDADELKDASTPFHRGDGPTSDPVVDALLADSPPSAPRRITVILDSAHNPVASRSLVQMLRARYPANFGSGSSGATRRLVLGLSSDRSPEEMLEAWRGAVSPMEVVACEADSTRAADALAIAAAANRVLAQGEEGGGSGDEGRQGALAVPREGATITEPAGGSDEDRSRRESRLAARQEHLERLRAAREAAGPGRARLRSEGDAAEPLPPSDPKRVAAAISLDGIGERYQSRGSGGDEADEPLLVEAAYRLGGARAIAGMKRARGSSVAAAVDVALRDALSPMGASDGIGSSAAAESPVVVIAGSVYLLAEARAALLRRAMEARPWQRDHFDPEVAEALLGDVAPDDVVK